MGHTGARTLKNPRVASGDVSEVVPADSGDHSHFEDKQSLTAMGLKYASCNVTDEESNSAANSNGRKFLYCSKGLDVISLLVKY